MNDPWIYSNLDELPLVNKIMSICCGQGFSTFVTPVPRSRPPRVPEQSASRHAEGAMRVLYLYFHLTHVTFWLVFA